MDEIRSTLPPNFATLVSTKNYKGLRIAFRKAEPADIAEYLGGLSVFECVILFRLLTFEKRAEVFSRFSSERKFELIDAMPESLVASVLNHIDTDDRTRFLEDLPFEIQENILAKLSPEERSLASELLSYPDDSVGRLMALEFLSAPADLKVSQAYEYIRWHARDHDELHPHLFVTDAAGKFLGEASFASLVLADPQSQTLLQIMDSATAMLHSHDDQSVAVDFLRKYDKSHIPVVNHEGILIGIVTADDVFDVAEEEATEDIQQFGGHATLDDPYFKTPHFTMYKKRIGWLSLLFVGELFTGTALRHYDAAIAEMRYLVYFVPLVISSGGNSGSQSASLIIRALAVKELNLRDWLRVFKRELVMGLTLGIALGCIGMVRSHMWGYGMEIGSVVFITLIGVVTFGSVAGAMLPLLIKACRLDPAVSSSPFIASLVDVTGIVIFFNVAIYLAKFWGH